MVYTGPTDGTPFSVADERDFAFKSLKTICDAGFISVMDFKTNPLRVFAAHEMVILQPAMGTKMTVQFNLFGGTVLKLGTERHHYLLPGIDTLDDVGCFALTELGYGNNAVAMETTATYDKATDKVGRGSVSILRPSRTDAHIDRIVCEAFQVVMIQDDVVGLYTEPILKKLPQLNLLNTLEGDLPWFMEHGLLSPAQGNM
eukprot:maker-scaffold1124_size61417-snap-gene-0.11 protein:Tk11340 transcript:maker-scaffold1124_size61417-snap-gene-0.11-mRNA-1 annotation:"predicted protein"